MSILVTGAAGFIGYHVTKKLLEQQEIVIGIDNLNDYYDVSLKEARLKILLKYNNFKFIKLDICDTDGLCSLFKTHCIKQVIHLAAQAGVRFSLKNPHTYIQSNIVGFMNILEECRCNNIEHLLYASSSSVYGGNTKLPFSEQDITDTPLSLYAVSKKANELMAHSYSHLFNLNTTGIRFFNVYGPWGRPDSALFVFTNSILNSTPIDIYNYGQMKRDFTYIDDVVNGLLKILNSPNNYKIYNLGNNSPVELIKYVETIENFLNKKAIKNFLHLQPGDVPDTQADVTNLEKFFNFKPSICIQQGVKRFIDWYVDYYNVR